ncbi:galectin-8-like [Ylistrum balloti]|uniref:galectin-8-like n=1 Tax=Ylistrum balloti TaxID=509963 RepID=UPI002905E040|nr:galectin-8-like [Ylistrum balloti]
MSYQISRVNLPATYRIPNGLHVGKQIIIRGRVTWGTDVFAINLQQEENPTDGEIAFHFNPRPSANTCVRNSFSGDWMEEETDQPHFPFDDGMSFLLRIEVAEDAFRTYVHGKPYINFAHRLDYGNVHYLHLTPGVEYYDITFQERYSLPYRTEIPGNMEVGKAVRVRGAAQDNDGFSINFGCDCENNSTAFHFNPRPTEGVVIRNANLGGWGDEERDYDAEFPFTPMNYFDAMFICTDDQYVVHVNDKYFTNFGHRCGVPDSSHFHIQGNMDIKDVEYYEPLDDDFVKEIPCGLEKGDVVLFRGFMKPGGDTFSVNLMNGPSADDDIAFHFNPRIGEGALVMNCRMGDWGEEEREDLPSCFLNNEPFEIKVVTKSRKFKLYVNGKKCAKFDARGQVEDIKGINVRGDAFIYQAKLQRKMEKPVAIERIPGGFREGGWVVVQGIPKKGSGGFAVNLTCGDDDADDIAMHFNPRLEENCTIRNTCTGGDWQGEERDQPSFPFELKDTFEVAINAQPDKFVTYVNGQRYIEYAHRLPLDSVCHVKLTGDADFFEPEFF